MKSKLLGIGLLGGRSSGFVTLTNSETKKINRSTSRLCVGSNSLHHIYAVYILLGFSENCFSSLYADDTSSMFSFCLGSMTNRYALMDQKSFVRFYTKQNNNKAGKFSSILNPACHSIRNLKSLLSVEHLLLVYNVKFAMWHPNFFHMQMILCA